MYIHATKITVNIKEIFKLEAETYKKYPVIIRSTNLKSLYQLVNCVKFNLYLYARDPTGD